MMKEWQAEGTPNGSTTWRVVGLRVVSKAVHIQTGGDGDVIDITKSIQEKIVESGLKNGTVTIFIQGSTAGVTTLEYEPGLVEDFKSLFERIAPTNIRYQHQERWHDNNGHSHARASLLGPSLTIPFNNAALALGTWQQVVIVDFDNRPRQREIALQLMGE